MFGDPKQFQVEQLEDRRMLAAGPQLVGIQPNSGELLTDGQVRHTEPQDLSFLFNSSADIDPTSVPSAFAPLPMDSVQITRSGLDGTFERSSVSSDFNTAGQVVLEFTAKKSGPSGNAISLAVTKSDTGIANRAPSISVTGNVISVGLNEKAGSETRAQDLVTALNTHVDASKLISARVKRGNASANIAAPVINYSPINLTGYNAATASSNFNVSQLLEIRFTAVTPGPQGNGIKIAVAKADLGANAGPTIATSGKTISVTLNTNPNKRTTAIDLVNAINADTKANKLVVASLPSGDPVTIIANAAITFSPITLRGANDIRIEPGYIALGDSPREIIVRFKEHLPDDIYMIDILGSGPTPLVNLNGEAFQGGLDFQRFFELDLGAQVLSVVPMPVTRDAQTGKLSQNRNTIEVYFNDDDLDPVTATDPRFYQLIHTRGTATNTDDVVIHPQSITYNPTTDMATLDFGRPLERLLDPVTGIPVGPGTFRLRIGTDEATPLPPRELTVTADPGSSFDTATNLDGVWDTGRILVVVQNGDGFKEGQLFTVTDNVAAKQTFEFDSGYTLQIPPVGAGPGGIVDGERFTISNGATSVTFEYDRDGSFTVGNTPINFAFGNSAVQVANSTAAAIAGAAGLALVPTVLGGGAVHLGGTTAHVVNTTNTKVTQSGLPGAQTSGAIPVRFVPHATTVPSTMATAIAAAINTASFNVVATASGARVRLANDTDIAVSLSVTGLKLPAEGLLLTSSIDTQNFLLDVPGGNDEPGHRKIPRVQDHLRNPTGGGDSIQGTSRRFYNFRDEYGFDPITGNVLHNAITEIEKQRAREIFEMYSNYLGVQFVESDNLGFTIVTGDLRAIDPAVPTGPGGVLGIASASMAIMDLQDFDKPGDDRFGGPWFQTAMHEIGHLLGMGHTDELPPVTLMNDEFRLTFNNVPEPVFPGDHDIAHGQHLWRPDSIDIDMYRFELIENGIFSAETYAERLADPSRLDTVITLYRANLDNTGRVISRELVSRNDDYFSNDSFVQMPLGPGIYYVGVSASGNTSYDPAIENTGFGGRSQGTYELRLNFRPDADLTIVDKTGRPLDGDADGIAGGVFNAWLDVAAPSGSQLPGEARTIFVDKMAPAGGDGSLAAPYNRISTALNVARTDSTAKVVRLVGNPGLDGDITTVNDNLAYEIGFSRVGGAVLADGQTLEVPKGVTVMVDANAILKLRRARIGVGSSAQGVDRSGGAFQVLGVPRLINAAGNVITAETGLPVVGSVYFTSIHDKSIGIDTNPDQSPPAPRPGDWGGIVYRNDLDLEEGNQRFINEENGIFLNTVNHAHMTYGGGSVNIHGISTVVTPVHMIKARPAIAFNRITLSADAAVSMDPDSARETNFHAPRFQQAVKFTSDYDRVGPDIHDNLLLDNSINGLFIRITTPAGLDLVPQTVSGRWDDTDIVHVVSENLLIQGTAGGQILDQQTPPSNLVGLTSVPGGTLTPGTYNYRIVFVDSKGNEGPPSDPTSNITIAAGTGTIRLANLPTLLQFPGFVSRRLYRSDPTGVGRYTLVAELNATNTTYVDNGTTLGGDLRQVAELLRARPDARLKIDPGTVVKLDRSRIDATFGAELIAEGRDGQEVIFTSIQDVRYGGSGTFDTNTQAGTNQARPGDWAGLFLGHLSNASLDNAIIAYGGGITKVEGSFAGFNAIEIHQSDTRIANSKFEFNADGTGGQAPAHRFGRGFNDAGTIFVRGAQPVILNNTIISSEGPAINVNANALNAQPVEDWGRMTGSVDRFPGLNDNQGPLIRLNKLDANSINGMVVRGGTLTTQGVWDDTDIVHVVFSTIYVPDFHTYGGLRLESNPSESLVVKLQGPDAGFTATGRPLDITDRIGGSVQIVGQPRSPVILTSFLDDRVGAGFKPDGTPQTDTNGDGDTRGKLPTGPEVNNGRLIDNDVAAGIPGQFAFQTLDGGASGFAHVAGGFSGGGGGISARGNTQLFTNTDAIFEFFNFLDVGSNGNAIELSRSTITMPATLVSDDLVVSEGTIQGANGTINWRIETHMNDGEAIVFNTLKLNSTQPLGNLRFINYLDEDILGPSDDLLFLRGTPGEADFRAFTLDGPERIGFSHGGFYLPGPGMQNATYDGWAADEYRDLLTAIEGGGTTYSVPGNIDTTSLPPINDPELGLIYGLRDITTAFAWSVNPTATSATMTSLLELVPRNPATAGSAGDWRSIVLDQFSHDRNIDVITEREARDLKDGPDNNKDPDNAQYLGALAPHEKSGDDTLRLGFEVHGVLSQIDDVDVYSFDAPGGTEVWLDIDRTTQSLDTVIELIDANGNIIAQSDNSFDEQTGSLPLFVDTTVLPGSKVNPLRKSPSEFYPESAFGQSKDLYSINPRDAGMRVVLPGTPGRTITYHVRVRSSNLKPGDPRSDLQDRSKLFGGLTAGIYQLQIRLREIDEIPGSTVQYADIRFATNGIEIFGQPAHSPLLGESAETTTANDTVATAQNVGNLLNTDRQALSTQGFLSALDDVDFYQFDVVYDSIQGASPLRHFATMFDVDYADGVGRPNTRISVFNADGRLVLHGTDSNIADDQPASQSGLNFNDLSRGSGGKLDPFIGTQELPEGRYFVAISSDARIPDEFAQFFEPAPANTLFRLEPINSIGRIAEERFDGFVTTAAPPQIPVLFDNSSAVPFHLGDVTLFVSHDQPGLDTAAIRMVDPFTGAHEVYVCNNLPTGNFAFDISDIAMRPSLDQTRPLDGTLVAFNIDNRPPIQDADTGFFFSIDTGDCTTTNLGNSGLTTWEPDPANPPASRRSNDIGGGNRVGWGIHFDALTFGSQTAVGTAVRGFGVGKRPVASFSPGVAYTRNILYEFNPNSGAAFSSPAQDRTGNALALGAGTNIVERGFLDTTNDPFGTSNTAIIAVEATAVNAVSGATTFLIQDGNTFSVDHDGVGATPPIVFEFNSGPEVLITPQPTLGISIRDGDTFFLDGIPIEFDTGSVIVVNAANGNFVNDGETITITNDRTPAVTRTFEFEKSGGFGGNNTPIFVNNGMNQAQVIGAIINAINGDTPFQMLAERLGQTNRISLRGESRTTGATTTAAQIAISGAPGAVAGNSIRAEETDTRGQLGAAILNAFNGNPGIAGVTAGVDGARVNFSGAIQGNFTQIINRGVFTNVGSNGLVQGTNRGIGFLAEDSADDIARRIEQALALAGIPSNRIGRTVVLNSPATYVNASPPLQIGGAAPGGDITGIAFVGNRMFAVSDAGGLWEVNGYGAPLGAQLRYVSSSAADLLGINFTGLSAGPVDTEGGAFGNLLFGIDNAGRIYSFDLNGVLQPVFSDGRTSITTGIAGANGLAFSTLDRNLWSVVGGVTGRRDDLGHGVETAFDLSRNPPSFRRLGGNSIHFGRTREQNTLIPYTYDLPGGAHGSIVSREFNLEGYEAADKPVLYFTYFAATEQQSSAPGTGPMRDSLRVFASSDNARWDLLATNNSHSPRPGPLDELALGPNIVQELFDTDTGWRQVRIPLDNYAGRSGLRLRIDFSSAGDMNEGDIQTVGQELRIIGGSELRDGQTFSITQSGAFGPADTFEVDMGFTVVAPTGAAIADGSTFTIDNINQTLVFEFDSGNGVLAGNIPVPYTAIQSAEDVAVSMQQAIQAAFVPPVFGGILTNEPNDTIARSVNTQLDGTTSSFVASGAIGENPNVAPGLDVDMLRLDLKIGSSINVIVDGIVDDLRPAIRLFDAFGNPLAVTNTGGTLATLNFTAQIGGTYYVGVSGSPNVGYSATREGTGLVAGDVGAYDITINVTDPAGVTQVNENRINLPATVSVVSNSAVVVDGNRGVAATSVPIRIHAGMTDLQVTQVIRQAMGNHFAGGAINSIKVFENNIRIIGHAVTNPGPLGLSSSLPGDVFGDFNNNLRGQNNAFEGIYLDDFIIGFAEHGEMATSAAGTSGFIPNPHLPDFQVLVGPYQLEIREGTQYGDTMPLPIGLDLFRTFDTNDRVTQGKSIIAPPAARLSDGQVFTLSDGVNVLTFEFDDVNLTNGVVPGRVRVPFDPSVLDVVTGHSNPQTATQVAAVILSTAGLSDGINGPGRFSTSNVVNLYGNANIDVILTKVVVTSTSQNGNALRDALLGGLFTPVGDATFVGGATSAGFFEGGTTSIGIESGILLTTGDALVAEGPNADDGSTGLASLTGDADLDAVFGFPVTNPDGSVSSTQDTTFLEFSFDMPTGGNLFFEFVFASEEYNEFVNSQFNDVFAFLIDGENIGFIPGTNTPVSINTVNGGNPYDPSGLTGDNPQFYNNNDLQDAGAFIQEIGYDGFTNVFIARKNGLAPGVHTIKLAIADVGDFSLDSGVFIRSFNSAGPDTRTRISGVTYNDRGDSNRFRDQGQVLIHSNRISNSLQFGIVSDAGPRTPEGNPHLGPPRLTRETNTVRLATGVAIANNVISGSGRGGIHFSGEVNAPGEVAAAVPFGRILNNTLVGNRASDTGILVTDNASPTILNNIVADFSIGLDIDASSAVASRPTVVGGMLYAGNGTNFTNNSIGAGQFPIFTNSNGLFVSKAEGNFYLAEGVAAIDSSVDSLQDRPAMVTLRQPLGYSASPILAPARDITGQLRVDDPAVSSPSGVGQNVFKDRGAIDRADFAGPSAVLLDPRDNDAAGLDTDPRVTFVELTRRVLNQFSIQLVDGIQPSDESDGTGADDNTVIKDTVVVTRDGIALEEGLDYLFSYNSTSNIIRLTPLAGIWEPDHAYGIQLLNRDVFSITPGDGGGFVDGDTFTIADLNNTTVTFEFDSGYTLQVPAAGGPGIRDGEIFTITVNNAPVRFEFDNNGSWLFSNKRIPFDIGDTPEAIANSMVTSIANAAIGLTPSHPGTGLVHVGGTAGVHVVNASTTSLTQAGLPGVTAGNAVVRYIPHLNFDGVQMSSAIADAINKNTALTGVKAEVRLDSVIVTGAQSVANIQNQFIRSIKDFAGNNLQPNRFSGESGFTIFLGSGLDFGDAPDPTYPTLKSSDGARHEIVPGYFLGLNADAEVDGQPTPNADGDTGDDGVIFGGPLVAGYNTSITVRATGTQPGRPGMLDAWMDFNGDGDWNDAGERIAASVLLVEGDNTLTFKVPGNAAVKQTFARFRLSSTGGLAPTGFASDGEVEDYAVNILPNPWQNQTNVLDVNQDGFVSPIDALLVINYLNFNGTRPLPSVPTPGNEPPPFLDVSGDGFASPIDALLVINFLNQRAGGEGERSVSSFGAEVSTLDPDNGLDIGRLRGAVIPVAAPVADRAPSAAAPTADREVSAAAQIPIGHGRSSSLALRDEAYVGDRADWDLDESLDDIASDTDDTAEFDAHDAFFARLR